MTEINESSIGSYRPDIDGLRAIAVSSVIAFHVGVPFVGGGFVGVDIFFVISGYLIGSIIHREVRAGRFRFAGFYARRAKRILPALFAVLLCCYLAASVLLTPTEMRNFAGSAIATILAVSNVRFWMNTSYFSPNAELNPLLMTWSLGVEEQFYLIFPVVMLVLARYGRGQILAIISAASLLSLALSVWGTLAYPKAAFFLLPTRAWELGAGTLLAIHESGRPVAAPGVPGPRADLFGCIGFALLVFAVFGYDSATPFPGAAAAIPVLGTALLIKARGGFVNRRLLAARPVVFVGLVSYSWYLWHWPFLSFARVSSNGALGTTALATVATASFAAAVLSWRFVERPFRRTATPIAPVLWRYATAAAVMLLPAAAFAVAGGWPQRFPAELSTTERIGASLQADPCLVNYGEAEPNLSDRCVPAHAQIPTWVLLGDSHAAALSAALRMEADKAGRGFLEFTKSSCPALAGVTRRMLQHPAHAGECAAFTDKALDLIRQNPTVETIFLVGYWSAPFDGEATGQRFVRVDQENAPVSPAESRENLKRGLRDTVALLMTSGKRVVLAKDVPVFDFDPVRLVETQYVPGRRFLAQLLSGGSPTGAKSAERAHVTNDANSAAAVIDRVAALYPALAVLDPQKSLCDERRCAFAGNGELYYTDDQHLSLSGAERVLSALDSAEWVANRVN